MALQDKLIDSLGSFATKFNSYRYIMAIKSSFITLMPVIIVGAFSVLISNMVLDPKNGLASFQALSFLAALETHYQRHQLRHAELPSTLARCF
ncbi:hypothetical protein CWS02_05210 [Enterobacter sp. EA-1]|nr:hypothetical protein CWS02_05210 [Enterobacter sp. EA-1]